MSAEISSCRPTPEARRQQILDAAGACVRRAGFHGASMAEIAQAADLSVGQIYRYFANKEAIIAAIVDQDLAEMREKFAELEASGEPVAQTMIDTCAEAIDRHYEADRVALSLEVLAEAARNPRVAAIVRAADAAERCLARRLLESAGLGSLSERELAARGEVLSMLFDGMASRAVNNPDGDRAAMSQILRVALRSLLDPKVMIAP
jgi:AcrR family transcriptional regulator